MIAPQYQLNKVRRLIADYGEEFSFERIGVNSFGEPDGVVETLVARGVYHEASGYVYLNKTTGEATTKRQKVFPMVLMLWEDAQHLFHSDRLTYKGHRYQVTEINNVGEAFVAAEVSMEEVQGP